MTCRRPDAGRTWRGSQPDERNEPAREQPDRDDLEHTFNVTDEEQFRAHAGDTEDENTKKETSKAGRHPRANQQRLSRSNWQMTSDRKGFKGKNESHYHRNSEKRRSRSLVPGATRSVRASAVETARARAD